MNVSNTSVKFGTSGLRGLAEDLTDDVCRAHARGFLAHMQASGFGRDRLCIGMDRRVSSERIAKACAEAAGQMGMKVDFAGIVPTPALALYAGALGLPAIMVTGSHNPEDQNGLKFYRPDGELQKSDEAPVLAEAHKSDDVPGVPTTALPPANTNVAAQYVTRFTNLFAHDCLVGLRLGLDLHSAAGSDLISPLLEALGANCVVTRRSTAFVAVDTEALDTAYQETAKDWITEHGLDAVVSTDGDGDRPLVIDADGIQIGGDVLGALAAHFLGFKHVVSPVSSTSALELTGWFNVVARTKIGSPYVISAMQEMVANGSESVAGFEANGGFLVAGTHSFDGKQLDALVTRDAMLPVIGVLCAAKRAGTGLAALRQTMPQRVMVSGRLKDYPTKMSARLIANLVDDAVERAAFLHLLHDTQHIDLTDGARFTLGNGDVVHFRPSGNAEELRCYSETPERGRSSLLADTALAAAAEWLAKANR